jgi:hypothetical protein
MRDDILLRFTFQCNFDLCYQVEIEHNWCTSCGVWHTRAWQKWGGVDHSSWRFFYPTSAWDFPLT